MFGIGIPEILILIIIIGMGLSIVKGFAKIFRHTAQKGTAEQLPQVQTATRETGQMNSYYNEEWNFSLSYPADWEIFWENEPAGSWIIPIGVASVQDIGGRAYFSVNTRRGEVLQRNSNLRVRSIRENGKLLHTPSTPREYIEMYKEDIQHAFAGVLFDSAEEIRIANKPGVKLTYSYEGQTERIQEECITLFCVRVTFQFICEMPANQINKYKPIFDGILDSFRIGSESPEESSYAEYDSEVTSNKQIKSYNNGVSLYRRGQFREAMEAFNQCYQSGDYQMQSAYAIGLCQQELGLDTEIPKELENEVDKVGAVFVVSNLVCYLIKNGYKAVLKDESCVLAIIDGSMYEIGITSFFGTYMHNAWRKEERKTIPIVDSSANPNPTEADKFVISLMQNASALPLSPLPEEGLPAAIE